MYTAIFIFSFGMFLHIFREVVDISLILRSDAVRYVKCTFRVHMFRIQAHCT